MIRPAGYNIILVFGVVLLLTACPNVMNNGRGARVARVFDHYLYEEDLTGIFDAGMTTKDSAIVRQQYIDKWINDMLVLERAEKNTQQFADDIDEQTTAYRNSLLLYYYEKEYVRQNLDTNISDQDIETYYDSHKQEFTLHDNIVQVTFVKLDLDAPNRQQVKGFLQSDSEEDRNKLRDYCERNAVNFYLQDDVWLRFDDLLREIPIKTYNQEAFLQNNRFIEMKDALYYYMLDIKGFRIKESLSPLSFERSNIRNILLNKRKLIIIDELRKQIMTKAVEDGSFEVYEEE